MTRVVYGFLHDANSARSRNRMRQSKQKLYRLNRPLERDFNYPSLPVIEGFILTADGLCSLQVSLLTSRLTAPDLRRSIYPSSGIIYNAM